MDIYRLLKRPRELIGEHFSSDENNDNSDIEHSGYTYCYTLYD